MTAATVRQYEPGMPGLQKAEVGPQKTTWRRRVKKERNALGWKSWGVAKPIARDRVHWRRNLAALWATAPEEDR